MNQITKWYKHYSPIAIQANNQMLVYKKGWLYLINDTSKKKVCKLPYSLSDAIKESNRIFVRVFRRSIRCSCIVDNEIYFFKDKKLYRYSQFSREIDCLFEIEEHKSNPLTISPALEYSDYVVLWGDYFDNKEREEVNIWGLNKKGIVEVLYAFPSHTIRHIHNIIADSEQKGYYIFTGDNDQLAGIYHSDILFNRIVPVYIGNQHARAVQGFCIQDRLIYATDSVQEQNYIFSFNQITKEKKVLQPINGSCIYACSMKGKLYFSTTVESPEMNNQNRIAGLLSQKRGKGILSNDVVVYSVSKDNLKVEKVLEFKKDNLPYKLLQYGVVQFVPSSGDIFAVFPVGVKKWDGMIGIME